VGADLLDWHPPWRALVPVDVVAETKDAAVAFDRVVFAGVADCEVAGQCEHLRARDFRDDADSVGEARALYVGPDRALPWVEVPVDPALGGLICPRRVGPADDRGTNDITATRKSSRSGSVLRSGLFARL